MLPKWCDKYSIHNDAIDKQHKKLFELAANVEMISDKPIHKGQVKFLLADFFNYMKEHFADEEKYMAKIGYPELANHQKIHKSIIQSMIDLIQNIKSTNDLKEKLNIIASKWLLEHILQEDMKIEKWHQQKLKNANNPTQKQDKNYDYICKCKGKIHKVTDEIHQKIQISKAQYKCKTCQEYIKLK
ncbi:bacteriohemerythrin [Campylobacter peloridis]|uniref:Hemerythrin-like metal-binding domain protein n=1 Tax=Campylobacter peloridis TaxID=488546 RepID=A0ABX6TT03_9BACT|nr:bacteriohemerythrin [Campylobacter peloridis]AJC85023.1 hemerythrin-like metal-binding domain protein [Campylobacter peloridis LMG 23910]MBX1885876.1 hemerythrin-like metal-binding domain protein [Campylobacter peloridis]MBX2078244.1 hemerythrin-like metal-binding domain protein [Campylobacter peloridis]QOQ89058.1 hemerythrin-like metal-binding domain protein [Campylobacter peloridis]